MLSVADKQVAIAGEIYDVNARADHDMRYQIPPAEFERMLEEARMSRGDAKTARAALFAEGFQMARAWRTFAHQPV